MSEIGIGGMAPVAAVRMTVRDAVRPRWLAVAALLLALAWSLGASAKGAPDSFADLVEKLAPAVVNISTTQTIKGKGGPEMEVPQFPPGSPFEQFFKDFFDKQQKQERSRKVTSLGSGFIIDPAGFIVTNNHVIADADEIMVTLQDDSNGLKAKIIGRDTKTDLALLKVEAGHPLPFVPWGDSDKARVGDWVVAIGNPFGLGGTVTAGIVSARARELNSGPYDDYLQTDAAINKGNSGGPMFNMAGEVIGINSAIYSPSGGSVGIGFAIPSALAHPVIEQLSKYGKTRRGWLGVRIQTVTEEIADTLGLPKQTGALVASVSPGGPAEKAAIQAGDVIVQFDGRDVGDMRHLPRMVAETEIGKSVAVVLWRKGKKIDLSVKVGELPETETASTAGEKQKPEREGAAKEQKLDSLGVSLASISPALRDQYEIGTDVKGVVVTQVKEGGAAAEKDLKAGDVIVEVSQEEVSTPGQVASRIEAAKAAGQKSVLLLVERGGDLRFVAVRVGPG